MSRRIAGSAVFAEPRAPAPEASGTGVLRGSHALTHPSLTHPSLAHLRHWLLLTLALLGVVLWTAVPAFAAPGRAPVCSDGEAHALPGEAPDHGPERPLVGERGEGEVEVAEDERESESESGRGLHADLARTEISTDRLGAWPLRSAWRLAPSKATPMTGGGCIRGPPSRRFNFGST